MTWNRSQSVHNHTQQFCCLSQIKMTFSHVNIYRLRKAYASSHFVRKIETHGAITAPEWPVIGTIYVSLPTLNANSFANFFYFAALHETNELSVVCVFLRNVWFLRWTSSQGFCTVGPHTTFWPHLLATLCVCIPKTKMNNMANVISNKGCER